MTTKLRDYETVCVIGSGSFGTCFKIKKKNTGDYYVWKSVNYGSLTADQKKRLVSEVNLMSSLQHPNIVRYYDRIIDKVHCTLYIIMEWCQGGDLATLINKCKKKHLSLEEGFIWRVLYQTARALQACHSHIIDGTLLHRDIKPANVFLDSSNNIKLGDFGLARILSTDNTCAETFVGTPYYMSPEVIVGGSYSKKSDVWAAGCLLYELCALNPPFTATDMKQLAHKIIAGRFPRIPPQYSDELQNILSAMLSNKPGSRPTVESLIHHPMVVTHVVQDTITSKLLFLTDSIAPSKENEDEEIYDHHKKPKSTQRFLDIKRSIDSELKKIWVDRMNVLHEKEARLQAKEIAVIEREQALIQKEKNLFILSTMANENFLRGQEMQCRSTKSLPHLEHRRSYLTTDDSSFSADPGDTSILPTSSKLLPEQIERTFMRSQSKRRVHFTSVPPNLPEMAEKQSTMKNQAVQVLGETAHAAIIPAKTYNFAGEIISKKNQQNSFMQPSDESVMFRNKVDNSKKIISKKIYSRRMSNCPVQSDKENFHTEAPTGKGKKSQQTTLNAMTKKFGSVINFR